MTLTQNESSGSVSLVSSDSSLKCLLFCWFFSAQILPEHPTWRRRWSLHSSLQRTGYGSLTSWAMPTISDRRPSANPQKAMLISESTLAIITTIRTNSYRSRHFLRRAASRLSLFALSSMIWKNAFITFVWSSFTPVTDARRPAHRVGLSFLTVTSDSVIIAERMSHVLILWPNKIYNSSRVEKKSMSVWGHNLNGVVDNQI